ncbi:MAG: hypothetical protein ABR572_09815 [Cryomorphaceae bacterium]
MRYTTLAFLFLISTLSAQGQGKVSEEALPMSLFQFQFGGHAPFGDMAELYGPFGSGGLSFALKTKSNFIFGADFNYFFSNNVHDADTRFSQLRFENGFVLGNEGEFIDVIVQKRGFAAGFYAGKIFNIFGPNPNSGLEVRLGINFLEHRTWIESREADIPPLEGEYRKAYDRKRAGLAAYQFVGYRHFSNSRFANFYLGMDFYQAFTLDYRTYNVDQMEFTDGNYLDFIVGIKAGWVIPIYKQVDDRFYIK